MGRVGCREMSALHDDEVGGESGDGVGSLGGASSSESFI